MKVTTNELTAIMQQGRRTALLPCTPDGPKPAGKHKATT